MIYSITCNKFFRLELYERPKAYHRKMLFEHGLVVATPHKIPVVHLEGHYGANTKYSIGHSEDLRLVADKSIANDAFIKENFHLVDIAMASHKKYKHDWVGLREKIRDDVEVLNPNDEHPGPYYVKDKPWPTVFQSHGSIWCNENGKYCMMRIFPKITFLCYYLK